MSEEHPQTCPECGSAIAAGQHYCLACGSRVGRRDPQLTALIERSRRVRPRLPAVPASAAPPGAVALRLPSRWVSALLVLLFLGFGALIGNATGGRVDDTLAASARRLKVLVPRAPAGQAASSTAASSAPPSASPGSAGEGGEPAAAPEPTPAPATPSPAPAARSTTPPAASAPSDSGEGGGGGGERASKPRRTEKPKLPPIKHVFVVVLSDEPYAQAFGPASTASYLTGTLEPHGALLVHYDAVAHEELANEIALISGQGPTAETAANCPTYTDIAPTGTGEDEQVLGTGCAYPSTTKTLAEELTAKHLSWRAYVQGIDEAGSTYGACAHPLLGAGDPTATQTASSGPYATFRNPFVYFQGLTSGSSCAAEDVGLSPLSGDLTTARRTPSFSYIVPDRCDDGNPTPCTPGAPAGMSPADAFLKKVVPEIESSPAYKQDGLLVITVDEAPSSGEYADSSSCCGQPRFPNIASTGVKSLFPKGGGAVGALLLSPYIKGAETSQEPYNHFSLLRTVEDIFGLAHLGYANLASVRPLEPSLFNASPGG